MKNKNISAGLLALGLNETEVIVYTTLLSLGTVPASTLAKRANLNRSTARYTLENLCKKQLAMAISKNNTFYFTPEDPEKILYLLKNEKKKLQQKEEMAKRIIGELHQIQNPHINMPKVQFFEGEEGIKNMFLKIIDETNPNTIILEIMNPFSVGLKNLSEYQKKILISSVETFQKKRIQKNIFLKSLVFNTEGSARLKKENDKILKREVYYIDPSEEFKNTTAILVTHKKLYTIIVDPNSLFSFSIEEKNTVDMYRFLFDFTFQKMVDVHKND